MIQIHIFYFLSPTISPLDGGAAFVRIWTIVTGSKSIEFKLDSYRRENGNDLLHQMVTNMSSP